MSEVVGAHAPSVEEMAVGDELSLFDTATGTAVALNQTARDTWVLADGVATLDEMVSTLANAYGVEPEDIAADVRAAVAELTRAGVLQPPPG